MEENAKIVTSREEQLKESLEQLQNKLVTVQQEKSKLDLELAGSRVNLSRLETQMQTVKAY